MLKTSTSTRKGEQTRAAIICAALELSSRDGLEGLTIGLLAERMAMSKSGVFAHFGSREDLQIAVLKEYERRFAADVLVPGLREPRGLPRLRAIFELWLQRTAVEAANGCIYISGATEYDDRPCAVRDELVSMIRSWQRELMRAISQCAQTGDLPADIDVEELVFQMYGVILVLHQDVRLMKNPDAADRARRTFDRLIGSYRLQASESTSTSTSTSASAPAGVARTGAASRASRRSHSPGRAAPRAKSPDSP